MYRIEYTTHNGFDAVAFADTEKEARVMADGLIKLKHVSAVAIIDASQAQKDRFMFCATCGLSCRLSQLPEGFLLDTEEEDNPWVWCPEKEDRKKCKLLNIQEPSK